MVSLLEMQRRANASQNDQTLSPSSPLTPYNSGGRLAASSSTLLTPSPFLPLSQVPETQRLPPLVPPAALTPLTIAQRVAFGERALKKVKLSEESLPVVREFLETLHPEEREILWFIRDTKAQEDLKTTAIKTAENWKPTTAQNTTMRIYAQMLVMLPDLHFFHASLGKTIAGAILLKNRYGFPTDQNDAYDAFVAACDRQATLAKNALKSKILVSIMKKTPIAQLADELIRAFGPELKHTLELHHRVAFIRMHVENKHPPYKFWSTVDDDLEELYDATPEEYVRSFQYGYTLNKQKYPTKPGSKSDSYPFGDGVGATSKPWVQNLNSAAKKVKRGDPTTQSRAFKRKVGQRDDTDDEEDGGSGGGDVDTGVEDSAHEDQQQDDIDDAASSSASSEA